MRNRFARWLGAHCAIVALLFGQFALAAYACPRHSRSRPLPRRTRPCTARRARPVRGDGVGARRAAGQCLRGPLHRRHDIAGAAGLPPVVLAPLPVPTLAFAKLATSIEPPHATGAVPRRAAAHLQFCRLLI